MSRAADNAFADPRTGLVLALGVAAIIAYLILKNAVSGVSNALGNAANAVGAATDAATTSIANAYVDATSNPAVTPSGSIVFPDGSIATVAQVSASNGGLSGPNFYWNGLSYILTNQFDANGNRVAQNGLDSTSTGWQ